MPKRKLTKQARANKIQKDYMIKRNILVTWRKAQEQKIVVTYHEKLDKLKADRYIKISKL